MKGSIRKIKVFSLCFVMIGIMPIFVPSVAQASEISEAKTEKEEAPRAGNPITPRINKSTGHLSTPGFAPVGQMFASPSLEGNNIFPSSLKGSAFPQQSVNNGVTSILNAGMSQSLSGSLNTTGSPQALLSQPAINKLSLSEGSFYIQPSVSSLKQGQTIAGPNFNTLEASGFNAVGLQNAPKSLYVSQSIESMFSSTGAAKGYVKQLASDEGQNVPEAGTELPGISSEIKPEKAQAEIANKEVVPEVRKVPQTNEIAVQNRVLIKKAAQVAKGTCNAITDFFSELSQDLKSKIPDFKFNNENNESLKKTNRLTWLLPILKEIIRLEIIPPKAPDTVDMVIAEYNLIKCVQDKEPFGPLPLNRNEDNKTKRFYSYSSIRPNNDFYSGAVTERTDFIDYHRPINDNFIKNGLSPPCRQTYFYFSALKIRLVLYFFRFSRISSVAFTRPSTPLSIPILVFTGLISSYNPHYSQFSITLITNKSFLLTYFPFRKEVIRYV